MNTDQGMKPGQSIRAFQTTRSPGVRIAYRPDWDAERPYITYHYGTAGIHCASLGAAKQRLAPQGAEWSAPA